MKNRGDGRVFDRKDTQYLWVSYYRHGEEVREPARHVRTGEKIANSEKGWHEAERFLKKRLREVAAETHGGPAFVGPAQQRLTVNELLDALKADYELRGKWSERVDSTVKKVREHFGLWRGVSVTSEAVADWQW